MRIENPNTRGYAGLCLDLHDRSKYVAGREKDLEFTRELEAKAWTLDLGQLIPLPIVSNPG